MRKTILRFLTCTLMSALVYVMPAGHKLASSAWFTATGQAVVVNGDTSSARVEATQEAIKQALLFAGASVTSVQQITNGLLMDDQLEVRANGEVNTVELIDEVLQDGILNVSIRADIFAQETTCSAADYTKKIATTHFPIRYQAQTSDGQIQALGEVTALKLKDMMDKLTSTMTISHIEPYVFAWHHAGSSNSAKSLAVKTNTQFVLSLVIDDVSVQRIETSAFNPFKSNSSLRSFNFTLKLINGATGQDLYTQQYESISPWDYAYTEKVNVSSESFWRSGYGRNVRKMLQRAISDLEEFAICQPTMGRVLAVANNQVQINLGRSHQVQAGDELNLFTVKQVTDNFGQQYEQFDLHPAKLVVSNVYNDTATAEPVDRSLLGNVQPNDFVSRQ